MSWFVTALHVAILVLLLIGNASIWIFSSNCLCPENMSPEMYLFDSHGKEKRDFTTSVVNENLRNVEATIVRIKKTELALDRLLSQIPRKNSAKEFPVIYGVTPTYARPTQKADLTRLCQTLQHVLNFHWIVVEDSEFRTDLVSRFLLRCGVNYTQLFVKTLIGLGKNKTRSQRWKMRGMEQRNTALRWIRNHFDGNTMTGVVYFVDDDNTYDVEIFKQMRWTHGVSVWPVGLVAGLKWEGPVCENKKVVGFRTAYKRRKRFPLDMAAFAVNAKLIINNPGLEFAPNVSIGDSETVFLSMITTRHELEPLANQCTKVLVWRTRTPVAKLHREISMKNKNYPDIEV